MSHPNKRALAELKSELKDLAHRIKTHRRAFRLAQSTRTDTWQQLCELEREKFEFRHKHIVRCVLKGVARDRIEQPKACNKADESFIKGQLEKYTSGEYSTPHAEPAA
jgi:hypothetical protein